MRDSTINQSEQKENNLSVVLRRLMTDKNCTRVKLAAGTGLAQATVTKIVSQLMAWGAVCEQECVGSGVGRRAIRLHLNGEKYAVAAVRINRDILSAAVIDLSGTVRLSDSCRVCFEEGAFATMDKLKTLIRSLMDRSPVPISAIGAAVPGPYDSNRGRITLMSGFPGWSRIDIPRELEEAFALPVFVEHDANCGAMAELWNGEFGSQKNLTFVAADMGIGAGMILDSRLYRGKDGFAGEIGHTSIQIDGPLCECGNRGCLELYASTKALQRSYRELTGSSAQAEEILLRVRQQEPEALTAYSKTVYALACGLVGIVNIINPDTMVFSGRLTQGGPAFLQIVEDVFRQRLMEEQTARLELRISDLETDPMLLGAGIAAFTCMLETPSIFFDQNKTAIETGGTDHDRAYH